MLQAISDIFLKYGLRSTSMDDICNHLKISKKTLYSYFENKDHLVEAVMCYRRDNCTVAELENKMQPYSAIEVLAITASHIIRTLKTQFPANNFDMKKYHPAIYEKIIKKDEQQIHDVLALVMQKGCKDGSFREDIDIEMQIYLVLNQFGVMCDPENHASLRYPVEEIIRTIFENLIHSLSTAKGLEEYERVKAEKTKEQQSPKTTTSTL